MFRHNTTLLIDFCGKHADTLLLGVSCAHWVFGLCMPQDEFAPICLKTTKELVARLPSAAGEVDSLRALLAALRLCCRIFFSLNAPGLTPVSGALPQQVLRMRRMNTLVCLELKAQRCR